MSTRPYTVNSMSKRREIAAQMEEAKKNVGIFTTNSTRQEVSFDQLSLEYKKSYIKISLTLD